MRGEEGFTLLEVTITLVMMSIGLLALVGTLSSMIELGDDRLTEIRQSVEVQNVITTIQTTPFEEISTAYASGTGITQLWCDPSGVVHDSDPGNAVATATIEVFSDESAVPTSFGGNTVGLDLDASGTIDGEVTDYQVLPVRITISHPNDPGVPDEVTAVILRP